MEPTKNLCVKRRNFILFLLASISPVLDSVVSVQRESNDTPNIEKWVESITYPPNGFRRILPEQIPPTETFPCEKTCDRPRWRSERRPESVHELRPGDIDVIGAMGDSITAGSGIREPYLIGVVINDRGLSFSGGGLATWRQFRTLPNILKVFNPNLVGYSVGRGDFLSYNAQLNVAMAATIDDKTLEQAKLLVNKMRRDPRINYTSDWKLLSIHTGLNDIQAYYCFGGRLPTTEDHKLQLQRALDYLYNNVPRLFVNIIVPFDKTDLYILGYTTICKYISSIFRPCIHASGNPKEKLAEMYKLIISYQDIENELASSRRYDGRKDFTVEWQPFFKALNSVSYPEKRNKYLYKMLKSRAIQTMDCDHFNPKGIEIWSTMLWNNLLEPVGKKNISFTENPFRNIKCPTKHAPYLFTKQNSNRYYTLGHQ